MQLANIIPYLEVAFPNLNIYVCCRDHLTHLFKNKEKAIPLSEMKDQKYNFAVINEIKCNMQTHPIEEFLNESKIKFDKMPRVKLQDIPRTAFVSPNSITPTRSLEQLEVEKLTAIIRANGYEITTEKEEAGSVWGVENEDLFVAAFKGLPTFLVPTGVGTNLYKTLFPEPFGKIIQLK